MLNSYMNYIIDFKKLDSEDKESEIRDNLDELFELILKLNTYYNKNDHILPTYNKSENDDFYDEIFTKIISLKEEIAKYIIQENGGI